MKRVTTAIYRTSSMIVAIAALVVILRPAVPQTRAASHPSSPGVGMLCNYVLPLGLPNGGQVRPAIIIKVSDQACDLILFDTTEETAINATPAIGAVTSVLRGVGEDEYRSPGSWHWVDRSAPETNTVSQALSPVLTGIDPSSAAPGSVVTLTGAHLANVKSVTLGAGSVITATPAGVPGTILQISDTSITVRMPAMQYNASYPVVAIDAAGSQSNRLDFTQTAQ
jgi:hypothetical protein